MIKVDLLIRGNALIDSVMLGGGVIYINAPKAI